MTTMSRNLLLVLPLISMLVLNSWEEETVENKEECRKSYFACHLHMEVKDGIRNFKLGKMEMKKTGTPEEIKKIKEESNVRTDSKDCVALTKCGAEFEKAMTKEYDADFECLKKQNATAELEKFVKQVEKLSVDYMNGDVEDEPFVKQLRDIIIAEEAVELSTIKKLKDDKKC